MATYIDTHAHPLMIKKFFETQNKISFDLNSLVDECKINNIKKIICISTQISDYEDYKKLVREEKNFYYFSLGIHPCDICLKDNILQFEILKKQFEIDTDEEKNNLIAIGETGIDLYHTQDNLKNQTESFINHIELALEKKLPLVIHTRNANQETYDILSKYQNKNIKGVIHCFNDSKFWAKKWIDLNFNIGIGGTVTYPKNKELRDVLVDLGILDKVILETDAPFLPPQTKRGLVNTPSAIREINQFIANLINKDEESTKKIFYENTISLFEKLK